MDLRDLCKRNWEATKARQDFVEETGQFNAIRLHKPTRYVREEGCGSIRAKYYCKGEIGTR